MKFINKITNHSKFSYKSAKIILALFIAVSCQGQEYYFINAKSGLNVRSGSSLLSKKTAKVSFGSLVEKIADTDKIITIYDEGKAIKGKFVKIKFNGDYSNPKVIEGYVFDAFLKKQLDNTLINITKIEKETYQKHLKSVVVKKEKPQKTSNLDSIKTILKDRVEWFDETTIKSIKLDNGKKLVFNSNIIDFGFSKGYSGYYPKEKILVLEGGHTSDVCFSIKTGEDQLTIGNPEYIIASPKNTYRLNGIFGGHECVSYFFQKKEKGVFVYVTALSFDYDICNFKDFFWISETEFVYSKMNYLIDSEYDIKEYFKGKILDKKEKL